MNLHPVTIKKALAIWLALKRTPGALTWATELAQHFWHPSGRPLGDGDLRDNLDAYKAARSEEVAYITGQLIEEARSLDGWEADMKHQIKDAWRVHYMAGRGGREFMTSADWGRVGGDLAFQFDRLENFAHEIAAGKLSPAQIAARAQLYVNAPHQAFESGRREAKAVAGYTQERRNAVMDSGTCGDCADYHRKGWQPINSLPPPGSGCACGANCRCEMEYRGQRLGEMTSLAAAELAEAAMEGGFTYHPATGVTPEEGLAFSIWKGREVPIPLDDFRWEHISNYVVKNSDILLGDDPAYFGGWSHAGMVYLDSSLVLPADQFDRVVKLCKIHEQIGFYNLGTGQYHNTEDEYRKLMERRAIPYYKHGIIELMSDKKKKPSVHLILDRPPDPDKDPEGFERWAKRFVDAMRQAAGLEPLYVDEGQ